MLKGFNKDGEIKNVLVTDDGAIKVAMEGGGQGGTQQSEIVNTSENPIPVILQDNIQSTLYSAIENVDDTPKTIPINKKVTTIDVANYSNDTSVTITIGQSEFEIGNNIATTLYINENVTNISLEATESAKIQIIVTGVR